MRTNLTFILSGLEGQVGMGGLTEKQVLRSPPGSILGRHCGIGFGLVARPSRTESLKVRKASKNKSRFFVHHPQTEMRLGPRSLRMTAPICDCGRPYGAEGRLPGDLIPGFHPGLFSDVPTGLGSKSVVVSSETLPHGEPEVRMGPKNKSRFFVHHPQTEIRLGPRSLRMTALLMGEAHTE
jgi:hypothetical protein